MPVHMPHTFSFDAAEPYFASFTLWRWPYTEKLESSSINGLLVLLFN